VALKQIGKLQTGTVDPTEFAFYGFKGGLNVKAAPQLVGDEDLTVATNGYLRPDGAFQLRNGMAKYNATVVAAGTHPLYVARFFQLVKNGASVAESDAVLGVFNSTLYKIPTTGASTNLGSVGTGVQTVTWVRFENPDDPNFASGLTDVICICTGSGGPYIWDGTNLYTPTGWSAATGARWCAIVNGILWFGGIPAYPNQIFGTGDGIIASMESLPAYRNFVFSSPVVGLCAQGTGATATLIVGRNTGISVLYGTGPSTFFLQDVPFQDGITSGMSMVSAWGVVYFLGHMAYYSFDAQTIPQPVSRKIEPWILNDPFTPGYPMTQNWNLTWSAVYNNRIHLGYCSNSATPNTILCLDLTLGGWTVLTTTPGIASMALLDAPDDPDPYGCIVGSSTTGQVYTWDYVNVSNAIAQPVLDDATPVLAQVQSKFFKLGVPGTNKALQRFYPEFLVTGAFSTNFTVGTDYGATMQQQVTINPAMLGVVSTWDVSLWDINVWTGTMVPYSNFGSPKSRIDYPGIQGESFSFGVLMTMPLAPWFWSGGSGVFSQRGRT
jgi:hypothetical protein